MHIQCFLEAKFVNEIFKTKEYTYQVLQTQWIHIYSTSLSATGWSGIEGEQAAGSGQEVEP